MRATTRHRGSAQDPACGVPIPNYACYRAVAVVNREADTPAWPKTASDAALLVRLPTR